MSLPYSPFRYPGGKSCLYPLIAEFLEKNELRRAHYAEPYAGGGSLALSLLFNQQVSDIHLNDIDPGIWSCWKSILDDTDAFVELIQETPLDVAQWRLQREIYRAADTKDHLTLGFATFFLNRTNRSGIIGSGGVIGGLQQTGNYKLDCRFNRDDLVKRVKRIRRNRSRIHLYNVDALDFLNEVQDNLPKRTFCAIDPPYYDKGSSLYTSFYRPGDHATVAEAVLKLGRPWVLTYDAADEIRRLYKSNRQYLFDIRYSVQSKRLGTELMVVSDGMSVPDSIEALRSYPQRSRAA